MEAFIKELKHAHKRQETKTKERGSRKLETNEVFCHKATYCQY
jgi:hypothetical protein